MDNMLLYQSAVSENFSSAEHRTLPMTPAEAEMLVPCLGSQRSAHMGQRE